MLDYTNLPYRAFVARDKYTDLRESIWIIEGNPV